MHLCVCLCVQKERLQVFCGNTTNLVITACSHLRSSLSCLCACFCLCPFTVCRTSVSMRKKEKSKNDKLLHDLCYHGCNFDVVTQMSFMKKSKSIKQGYNTRRNYDISYFSIYWFRRFFHNSTDQPSTSCFSLPKINYLRGNGKIIEGTFKPWN